MFKHSIKAFVYSSVAFFVMGVVSIFTDSLDSFEDSTLAEVINKIFILTVFSVLLSFALSIAGLLVRFNDKYLKK